MANTRHNADRDGHITREDFIVMQKTISERLDRLHTIMEHIGPTPVDEAFSRTLQEYGGIGQLEEDLGQQLTQKSKELETALTQKIKAYEARVKELEGQINELKDELVTRPTAEDLITIQKDLDKLNRRISEQPGGSKKGPGNDQLASKINKINHRLDAMEESSQTTGSVKAASVSRPSPKTASARKKGKPAANTSTIIAASIAAAALIFVIGFVVNLYRGKTPPPQTKNTQTLPPMDTAPAIEARKPKPAPVAADNSTQPTSSPVAQSPNCPSGVSYEVTNPPRVSGANPAMIAEYAKINGDPALLTILGLSRKTFQEDLIKIAVALNREHKTIAALANDVLTHSVKVSGLSILNADQFTLRIRSAGKKPLSKWLSTLTTNGKPPIASVYQLWLQLAVSSIKDKDGMFGGGSQKALAEMINTKGIANFLKLKTELQGADGVDPLGGTMSNLALDLFGFSDSAQYKRHLSAFRKQLDAVPFPTNSAFVRLQGPAGKTILAQTCTPQGPTAFGQWLYAKETGRDVDDHPLYLIWLAMQLGASHADGTTTAAVQSINHIDKKDAKSIAAVSSWN